MSGLRLAERRDAETTKIAQEARQFARKAGVDYLSCGAVSRYAACETALFRELEMKTMP
jgi:hypothetical protein